MFAGICFPKTSNKLKICLFSCSEVKLSVASFLSDRIVDEILDALSSSHHKLVRKPKRRSPVPLKISYLAIMVALH